MPDNSVTRATEQPTRRALLDVLKRRGARKAADLSRDLGVSAMAVRQHLYAMQEEGLVGFAEEARPRGRPAKRWHLTEAADRYFPDAHSELTVGLLESMRNAFGEANAYVYDMAHKLMERQDLFDATRIDPRDVERYGKHELGRHMLLGRKMLEAGVRLQLRGHEFRHARTFSDVAPGQGFWYENSCGLVEFALNGENAASQLGLEIGDSVRIIA